MAYTKTTWTDRVVQYIRRYTDELGNVKTFTPNEGTITNAGTAVTAVAMNKLEQGVYLANNKFDNTSGTDTYAVAITGVAAYADILGTPITIKFTVANTTACTLNVNSIGAIAIVRGTATALATGDIIANKLMQVVYDGTSFQLLSEGGNNVLKSTTEEWIPIATTTVANATTNQVDFSSISTSYSQLKLEITSTPPTSTVLTMRVNGNSGAAVYEDQAIHITNSTILDTQAGPAGYASLIDALRGYGDYIGFSEIKLISLSGKNKTYIGNAAGDASIPKPTRAILSGTIVDTNAITSIALRVGDFSTSTNYFGNGTIIRLYGKV